MALVSGLSAAEVEAQKPASALEQFARDKEGKSMREMAKR